MGVTNLSLEGYARLMYLEKILQEVSLKVPRQEESVPPITYKSTREYGCWDAVLCSYVLWNTQVSGA